MKQYLCFKLRGHILGIEIGHVVEIMKPESKRLSSMTSETGTFEYQGKTLTAIHLVDILLGEEVKYDTSNRVLITRFGDNKAGLIVDSAEEILRITDETIHSLDSASTPLNCEFLDGYIASEERNIYLVSPDKLHKLIGVA